MERCKAACARSFRTENAVTFPVSRNGQLREWNACWSTSSSRARVVVGVIRGLRRAHGEHWPQARAEGHARRGPWGEGDPAERLIEAIEQVSRSSSESSMADFDRVYHGWTGWQKSLRSRRPGFSALDCVTSLYGMRSRSTPGASTWPSPAPRIACLPAGLGAPERFRARRQASPAAGLRCELLFHLNEILAMSDGQRRPSYTHTGTDEAWSPPSTRPSARCSRRGLRGPFKRHREARGAL